MADFVGGIVSVISALFTAILQAFGSIGELVFVIAESGITGLTPFGWLMTALIGIPLATWLFSKAIGFVKNLSNTKK